MKLLGFATLIAIVVPVHSANDWSVPCLDGTCQYDLPSTSGASGTLQVVRLTYSPTHFLYDIPAYVFSLFHSGEPSRILLLLLVGIFLAVLRMSSLRISDSFARTIPQAAKTCMKTEGRKENLSDYRKT
jgi:hypothetical protein